MDKLSISYKNYLYNTEELKKEYIQERRSLSDLAYEKEHYMLEFATLVEQFETYANRFLQELAADETQYEKLQHDVALMQERFGL